jgi:hypothetical protein
VFPEVTSVRLRGYPPGGEATRMYLILLRRAVLRDAYAFDARMVAGFHFGF